MAYQIPPEIAMKVARKLGLPPLDVDGDPTWIWLPPRDRVLQLAGMMEMRLRKHDDDWGAQGWREMTPEQLLDRIEEKTQDLFSYYDQFMAGSGDSEAVKRAAADLANFGMFVWDLVIQAMESHANG